MAFTEFCKLSSFRVRERLPFNVGGLKIFHGKVSKAPALFIYPFKTLIEFGIFSLFGGSKTRYVCTAA
jgi:hypothetical protein